MTLPKITHVTDALIDFLSYSWAGPDVGAGPGSRIMSADARLDENLTGPQRRAIEALASGATTEQAAVAADRTPATLRRWRREDDVYNEALQDAADEALGDAAVQLRGLLKKALSRLSDVLEDDEVKTHHLLRAVDMVASHTVKLTEFAELEERVTALEERLTHE